MIVSPVPVEVIVETTTQGEDEAIRGFEVRFSFVWNDCDGTTDTDGDGSDVLSLSCLLSEIEFTEAEELLTIPICFGDADDGIKKFVYAKFQFRHDFLETRSMVQSFDDRPPPPSASTPSLSTSPLGLIATSLSMVPFVLLHDGDADRNDRQTHLRRVIRQLGSVRCHDWRVGQVINWLKLVPFQVHHQSSGVVHNVHSFSSVFFDDFVAVGKVDVKYVRPIVTLYEELSFSGALEVIVEQLQKGHALRDVVEERSISTGGVAALFVREECREGLVRLKQAVLGMVERSGSLFCYERGVPLWAVIQKQIRVHVDDQRRVVRYPCLDVVEYQLLTSLSRYLDPREMVVHIAFSVLTDSSFEAFTEKSSVSYVASLHDISDSTRFDDDFEKENGIRIEDISFEAFFKKERSVWRLYEDRFSFARLSSEELDEWIRNCEDQIAILDERLCGELPERKRSRFERTITRKRTELEAALGERGILTDRIRETVRLSGVIRQAEHKLDELSIDRKLPLLGVSECLRIGQVVQDAARYCRQLEVGFFTSPSRRIQMSLFLNRLVSVDNPVSFVKQQVIKSFGGEEVFLRTMNKLAKEMTLLNAGVENRLRVDLPQFLSEIGVPQRFVEDQSFINDHLLENVQI